LVERARRKWRSGGSVGRGEESSLFKNTRVNGDGDVDDDEAGQSDNTAMAALTI
jgi:hypothetical protein